jgi:hypothetical protein
LLRQAREARQTKLGADHPHTLESKHELALVYIATADYDRAEPLLLDAFHGRETKLGPEHPDTVDSLRELVRLYESWDKPDEAAKYRAMLPAQENAAAGGSIRFGVGYLVLGNAAPPRPLGPPRLESSPASGNKGRNEPRNGAVLGFEFLVLSWDRQPEP